MKRKLLHVLMLGTLLVACKKSDDSPSRASLFTGSLSKTWKVTADTDDADEVDESCKSTGPVLSDNSFTFKKDGTFVFNNGTVTEPEVDCDDCCSDLANSSGTWNLFSNNDSLKITLNAIIDGSSTIPTDPEELVRAKVESITSSQFVLNSDGEVITFKVK